jgi:hypothetical protein
MYKKLEKEERGKSCLQVNAQEVLKYYLMLK